ncbi:branched-chain amino acid ABC transporter permease [Nocardioides bizhenqiangii]|uniref:Branched-chain amino acid ABC transporter permease n=1 Tax=Nocardioides bizhenqiangii TaxID=3095076 RepID=A0ABZ0ZN83_9ACTN|nr:MULTISPECIES: branched-chain amino acid ABC transporter permease [unclassified Nocardioides]MDZ5620583.1 branched-chain amino acid ABC transporter permease [Nocardioides sp. HM23]WQQ24953.1 branched-chain amino acid ABC transporter permease [Nocardioides sp. HM61]
MDWNELLTGSLQQALGPTAAVYCLAAIGLNIHFGYTGLLNFGQAGFMMVAGYAMVTMSTIWSQSLWLGVLVGIVLTVILALLLGVPTLRLRADYLAIVTIAAAEIIRQVISAAKFSDDLGGQDGLTGFIKPFRDKNPFSEPVGIDGLVTWSPNDFWVMTVGWGLVAVSCLVVWLLMRSPWGRVLKSIREDEDAVRSLGKNVYSYKMQSLIIGGLFGALAGFVVALRSATVGPSFFATDVTFFAYTVLLIGGAARVLGPVAGAVIFWFLITVLDLFFGQATAGANPIIPTWIMNDTQASLMRLIFMGLGLMLLMIYRPQGIFGDRRELALDAR